MTVDENNAVLPGVKITIINASTGSRWYVITNSDGYFVVPLLPPSRYTVEAQRQGFATVRIVDVVLNVNGALSLNIQLKVGHISESVLVEGSPLVNAESAAVRTVVDRQFVENLPLNGRSFNSLIELTPGTLLTKSNFNNPGQFSVNGQRSNANYYTVDGVSANVGVTAGISLGQTAGGTIPAFSALGGTNNLVSIDALQEFSIQTSTYAAEFGRMPGAQVSMLTRSGTNQFHGTLFEYFRNDAFDSNDWFANSRGLRKPALRQNDFGGVLGGPVMHDRTFFFFSYEGLRLRQPQARITAVPSVSARQIAQPQIKPFLNAFPLPNGRDLGGGFAELAASYSNPSTLNATSFRVDQKLGNSITFFGRYNRSTSEMSERGGPPDLLMTLSTVSRTLTKTVTLTLGSTQTLSASLSNDFRFNYSRNHGSGLLTTDNFGGAVRPPDSLLFPPFASPRDSLFSFALTDDVAFYMGKNTRNLQRQFNLVDTFALVKGSHEVKLGLDLRRLSPVLDTSDYLQIASFVGVTGALTGRAAGVQISAKSGRAISDITNFSAYAQDTWRMGQRLTVTYGLRWEVNPSPSARNADALLTATGLDDPATIHLLPSGTPPWKTSYTNFAPRVGVAYQLSGAAGQERVLRGGVGIFYDTAGALGGVLLGLSSRSTTLLFDVVYPVSLDQATPPPPTVPTPPYSFIPAFDPHFKLPRTYQWNVALEESLSRDQTITASYVGAAGRNLLRRERLFRPNAEFLIVNAFTNSATSDYHALQLQYKRRLSHGLQALASYTWSHSIDISSSDSAFGLPSMRVDPKLDRTSSDFDVRHSLSTAASYDFPSFVENRLASRFLHNWSIDVLYRARTATPVNILTGRRLFNVFGVSRPDLVPGVPLYVEDPNVAGGRRINRAAFSVPPPVRQGTFGRNALRGFPVSQLDLALRRQFSLTEKLKLQLRAELFNAFNHPNFGDPVNDLGAGDLFGQSVTMLGRDLSAGGVGLNPLYQVGGPRSIQLALRLNF